jgi:Spy/CpxP family protein refolding chaperone
VSPWKVILATMVIFACGVLTGAMVSRTVATKSEEHPLAVAAAAPARMPGGAVAQMQRVLDKQLDLSAEQRDQIGRIMKSSQERTRPLWEKIAPQMADEIKNVRGEIRDVLTPEQWKKFVELMRRNRKAKTAPASEGNPARPLESPASTTNATSAL